MPIEVTVVIPILNEADILEERIHLYNRHFNEIFGVGRWKYTFINNRSSDRSDYILKYLTQGSDHNVLYEERRNYGRALKRGLSSVTTTYATNVNIDEFDCQFLRFCWERRDRVDIAIASKMLDMDINEQPQLRRALSIGLNILIRVLFGVPTKDTHGPKFFNMKRVRRILRESRTSLGLYDTEIVIRGLYGGLKTVEIARPHKEFRRQKNYMIKKVLINFAQLLILFSVLFPRQFRKYRFDYTQKSRNDIAGS